MAGLHVWRWARLAPHWWMWSPAELPVMMCETSGSCVWQCVVTRRQNSTLCRVHSDFFLSSSDFHPHRLGAQGFTAMAGRRSLLILNTCAGKGPDLALSAVDAVRIANPQQRGRYSRARLVRLLSVGNISIFIGSLWCVLVSVLYL